MAIRLQSFPHRARGFLVITAAIIIAVVALMASGVTYLLGSSSQGNADQLQATQAFYLAEAGLVRGRYALNDPVLTSRLTCSNVSGNAAVTNVSFGQGQFTVTSSGLQAATTSLSSALTATASRALVQSTASLASAGSVQIDGEALNYSALGAGIAACGVAGNCLLGLTRGQASTVASQHASGNHVVQYACGLQAIGAVSSMAAALGKKVLASSTSLYQAWLVGNRNGSNFTFARYNGQAAQGQWASTPVASSDRAHLKAISMINLAEGWAVGQTQANQFTLLHYNPILDTWQSIAGPSVGNGFIKNLHGVSTVSQQEAWAVGDRSDRITGNLRRYTLLRWDGSAWCALNPAGTTCGNTALPADIGSNRDLTAVAVLDASGNGLGDVGFAVGDRGTLLIYNGTTHAWTRQTAVNSDDLRGVAVVKPVAGTATLSQAWAVGASGTVLRYQGGATPWVAESSPTSEQLNSVAMLDTNSDGLADEGWAVGNDGAAVHIVRQGSSYTLNIVTTPTRRDLMGVAMVSSDDVWAVGSNSTLLHWDGSSWTVVTPPLNRRFNALAIAGGTGPAMAGWQQHYA